MWEPSVLLFDLDGTLTDPGEGITNSVAYALRCFGIEPPPRQQLYCFIGPPLVDSFRRFYGFSDTDAHRAVDCYREYYRDRGIFENVLYDGMDTLLHTLCEAGYQILLATSKPEPFAVQILEHFHLLSCFYRIAGALMDESRTGKADVIAHALAISGCKSDQCVMIGDREYDILGAKAHNMPAIGVLYGYGSREELHAAGATQLVETVADLQHLLLP